MAAMMGGNPNQLARQMQQMQAKLAKIQEELGSETVEASVGGGMVTIVMTGHQQVESVKIDPEALDPEDVETIQDLMVAAFNEALRKSQELAGQRLGALTGGMKIPGLF
jgi:DNA-binding YbaB/EbfC family protein